MSVSAPVSPSTDIPPSPQGPSIQEQIQQVYSLFNKRTDQIVAAVSKDKTWFYKVIDILSQADHLDHHSPEVTFVRVKAFDVLVGAVRDFSAIEKIHQQLERDRQAGTPFSPLEEILYSTNLFLYGWLVHLAAPETLQWGKKTQKLLQKQQGMEDEKLRLTANFIQHYALTGQFEKIPSLIKEGETYFNAIDYPAYQALFIMAQGTYFNQSGQYNQTINLFQVHYSLLTVQAEYPPMAMFAFLLLAEARLKKGEKEKALSLLTEAEGIGKAFFVNAENGFFARLYTLQALAKLEEPFLAEAQQLLDQALHLYSKLYGKEGVHKHLASVYLTYGKYYLIQHHPERAIKSLLKAQQILDQVLTGPVEETKEVHHLLTTLSL